MQKYFHLFLEFIACKIKYLNITRTGIRRNFISLNCIKETAAIPVVAHAPRSVNIPLRASLFKLRSVNYEVINRTKSYPTIISL
jgi:hypothetical protein